MFWRAHAQTTGRFFLKNGAGGRNASAVAVGYGGQAASGMTACPQCLRHVAAGGLWGKE